MIRLHCILEHCIDTWAKSNLGQIDYAPYSDAPPAAPPFSGTDGLAWEVSRPLFMLGLLAIVVWIVWRLIRGNPAVRIQIRQGIIQVTVGKVRASFLSDLADVLQSAGLKQGSITGHNQGGRIVLKFSHEFSPAVQQQIRNTWYSNS